MRMIRGSKILSPIAHARGDSNAFHYFRILQTGENSTGNLGIFLSGIELYGVLIEIGL